VPDHIPGHQNGIHSAADWQFWRNGMQDLVDAVRSAGATQVIVAMALDDDPLLQGFDDRARLNDPNVVYEFCPMHRTNLTDAQRDVHFGFLAGGLPLLANDWDLELDESNPDCQSIPTADGAAAGLVRAAMD